jgi:KDO2-lipid IV(A) lauroyltransferase
MAHNKGVSVIGFYLFLGFEKLIMLLPHRWRKSLFIALANLAYRIDKKHRRVILQNLHFALGKSCSATEEEQISRYCYRNLLLNLLQVIENRTITQQELQKRITFENVEIVEHAKASGRPIIFVTAHYGIWELAGAGVAKILLPDTPMTTVHKAMNNAYFERYLHEARSNVNMKMVEKRGAVKQLARALKNGETITLLTDQNTNKQDGIVVEFFGHKTRKTNAPAYLARKYNAIIISGLITTDDDSHYTVRFYEPIEVAHTEDEAADILEATQRQASQLEGVIRRAPKFWFWCHRRWKTEHPEIYR